jgi:hypothetical protein
MKIIEKGNKIRRNKSDLKRTDWLFVGLGLAAIMGAIVTFTKRQNFIYYCLGIILCGFVLLYRKISRGKNILIKNIILFIGTILAFYWSFSFFITSFPVNPRRSPKEELFLQETEGFSKVYIPFQDGRLEGWLYSQSKEPEAPLFIFFSGAGECSADSMSIFYKEGNLIDYLPDYNFLCFDYPGYGKSDGLVYESAMKNIALRIYDEVVTWDGIDEPVLVLTSDIDSTCTYKSAKRVADRLKNSEIVILSGVKHENMLCDETFAAISEFLE